MDRETIIKLAREQGLPQTATEGVYMVNTDDLARMLAAEREACAKACEEVERKATQQPPMVGQGCQACAATIRARGNHGQT